MGLLSLREKHEYEQRIADLELQVAKLKPQSDKRAQNERELRKSLKSANDKIYRWKKKYRDLLERTNAK